jgi:hypothetical protein
MDPNDDVVYRRLRLGSLNKRQAGPSCGLVGYRDRLHDDVLFGLEFWKKSRVRVTRSWESPVQAAPAARGTYSTSIAVVLSTAA